MNARRIGNGIYELNGKIAIVSNTDHGIEVWECARRTRCRVMKVRKLESFKGVPAAVAFVNKWLEEAQ